MVSFSGVMIPQISVDEKMTSASELFAYKLAFLFSPDLTISLNCKWQPSN